MLWDCLTSLSCGSWASIKFNFQWRL
jgi:hypothetical protein